MCIQALGYCEVIAGVILQNPSLYTATLVTQVHNLASRLKYYDPQRLHAGEDMDDPAWLTSLGHVLQQFNVCIHCLEGINQNIVQDP